MPQHDRREWGTVYVRQHRAWESDLRELLARAGLAARLQGVAQLLLKPNLVEARQPPVTTPLALTAALVEWLREKAPACRLIIGEGCGASSYSTDRCFDELGYSEFAGKAGVELVDLNQAELVTLENPECRRWPAMRLPRLLFESFLISLPVLKVHTLAGVTLTMKNMMGVAPPSVYQQGGRWKKAGFHDRIQEAILDLNRYRAPDFTVLDATVGMSRAHLWGPTCDPPPNQIVAGYDPVAVDAHGCALLGKSWQEIGHVRLAHQLLGQAEPLRLVTVAG